MKNYWQLLEKLYEIKCNGTILNQYRISIDSFDHPGWYPNLNISRSALLQIKYLNRHKNSPCWTDIIVDEKMLCSCGKHLAY